MDSLLYRWEMTDKIRKQSQLQQQQTVLQSREFYGQAVRSRRQEAGLSMKVVAEQVGCSIPMISDIEHGKRFPSRALAGRISNLFDTPETF